MCGCGWSPRFFLTGVVAFWATCPAAVADLRIATYNVLQLNSSPGASRESALRTVLAGVNPDVLVVQEIVNLAAVNNFRLVILNGAGGPGESDPYSSDYIDDVNSSIDQAIFYRASKATLLESISINTSPRDTYRWKLRPASDPGGGSDFYFYSMHLDAADEGSRAAQTNTVRTNANALPAGSHFIYAGDFNIDSSTEQSYQNLIGSQADNDGRGFDPINMPGDWNNNASFAAIHTQSPNNDNSGAPGGAATGGLDDRFDFLLISEALQNGMGLDYISGSYQPFGNDGLHFNDDINDPPTIPEGSAMADALHASSDHLPVLLDLLESVGSPDPIIGAPSLLSFGAVLVGATSQKNITVQNTATPPAPDLEYSFAAPAGFIAPGGMFIDPAGGGGNVHVLTMITDTSGNKMGTLVIDNNSINDPMKQVSLSGTVLDHAVPSTVAGSQVLVAPLDFGSHGEGEFSDQFAEVYNAGSGPFTVALEVTGSTITNDAAGRFSIIGPTTAGGISATPAQFQIHFDDADAAAGAYTANLECATADDSPLPGAMALGTVIYNLSATVVTPFVPGDLDGSGCADEPDVPLLVALILDPDAASPTDRQIADVNGDGENDGRDIGPFVEQFLLGCP